MTAPANAPLSQTRKERFVVVMRSTPARTVAFTALGMGITLLFDQAVAHAGSEQQLDTSYPLLTGLLFAVTTLHEAWFFAGVAQSNPERRWGWFGSAAGGLGLLTLVALAIIERVSFIEGAALSITALAFGLCVPLNWVRARALREGNVLLAVGTRYLPVGIGLLIGVIAGRGYEAYLIGLAVGSVMLLATLAIQAKAVEPTAPKAGFRDGGWLTTGSAFLSLTLPADIAIAGTLGPGNKSIYSLASRYALSAVAAFVTPLAMGLSAWLSRRDSSHRTTESNILLMSGLAASVATIPLAFAAPLIIERLLDDTSIAGSLDTVVALARILCLLLPVQIIGTFASRMLIAKGKQRVIAQIAILTLIADVTFDVTFGNAFGVRGLGWASVAAWSLSALLLVLANRRGHDEHLADTGAMPAPSQG